MNESKETIKYIFKYIIVGNAAVGKSNICYRFTKGEFIEQYQVTINLDFTYKNIKIGDNDYRIQIWDTVGQECFKSISRGYYKNSVCALVVYDITNRDTFNNVLSWIDEVKKNGPNTITLILVGNKSDLNDKRVISIEEGENFAHNNNMLFYETSALTGDNINKLFEDSIRHITDKIKRNYYDLGTEECGIKIEYNKNPKKKKRNFAKNLF